MINYMQMGLVAAQKRDLAAAVKWFEHALAQSPDSAEARTWLGQTLCSQGRRQQGIAHLLHAAEMLLQAARDGGKTGPLLDVAKQLLHWGEVSAATELLADVAQDFGDFQTYQLLAAGYAQLNKKQEALQAARCALEADPANVMMQVFLGSLEADAGLLRPAKERLLAVLAEGAQAREAFRAHKELARILDRLGECESVFPHLDAAGELTRQLPEYAKQDKTFIPGMIALNRNGFTRESMQRWKGTEMPADLPAPTFVVGFLRSGTTLMQEVLDAHPGIFVADEADFISRVKRELHNLDKSTAKTPEKLANLDRDGVLHLRRVYWELVRARFGDAIEGRKFVDKFTMNTLDLGLINTIFPDAKVLFLVRDPRDVCLSCLFQLMVPTLMTTHVQTWAETADIYGQAMDWWFYIREKLSLDWMEVRYEDVVADFEGTFRQVFAFLGTEWDAGVSLFHQHASRKFVATPSRSQVAQPLYASSVERWRQYAPDVARVANRLGPYVQQFGYPSE